MLWMGGDDGASKTIPRRYDIVIVTISSLLAARELANDQPAPASGSTFMVQRGRNKRRT